MRPSFFIYRHFYCNKNPQTVAEVGVFRGDNAQTMIDNSKNTTFYLIDDYPNNSYRLTVNEGGNADAGIGAKQLSPIDSDIFYSETRKRFNKYGDMVRMVRVPSPKAAELFVDEFFDYVYIDGSHIRDDVFNDITAWYPKVKKGGVLAGHDWLCNDVKTGVFDALGIIMEKNNVHVSLFGINSYSTNGVCPAVDAEFQDWWMIRPL